MVSTFAYLQACLKKIRRILRRDRICEIHICKQNDNSKMKLDHPGYYCIVRVRNIMCIFIAIVLLVIFRASHFRNSYFQGMLHESSRYYLKFKETYHEKLNISDIKRLIDEYNTNETIRNTCTYDYAQWKSLVFVVSVKKYTPTLKYFVVSLNQVEGIEEVLLIFSHSYYDENVNKLISRIDFCRVQQIFYPYSLQVYPDEFPGLSPNDCPHDMDIKMAVKKNCTGAGTPDVHGFFRDPKICERKHQWWWSANKVFENPKYQHDGLVVFMDDDLYLLEDFVYMIKKMKEMVGAQQSYDFISLGTPMSEQFENEVNNTSKLEIAPFDAEYHSTILAFDKNTWNKIVGHYDQFCGIDESSWANSLFHLSKNVYQELDQFKVISTVQPRAINMIFKGVFKKVNQANFKTIFKIEPLFPETLNVYIANKTESKDDAIKEAILSGGWSDPRDIKLCSNMTVRKVKKLFFDMANQFLSPS